jgi:protein involved in polysaccharide export with SLBB domain
LAEKNMSPITLARVIAGTIALLYCLLLTGCSTPGTYMGTADVHKPVKNRGQLFYPVFIPLTPDVCAENSIVKEYRVGPQDILNIIVWNHPELTIPSMQTTSENVNIFSQTNEANKNPAGILVNQDGDIFFSLAGRIKVEGMTVEQIRQEITDGLVKYIRHPQVSVRVASFRNKPIYIVGEVFKSGVQFITDFPVSIMDAINEAGGIDKESSDTHYVYVMRGNILHPNVYWLDMSSPGAMLMAVEFKLKPRDIVVVSTAGVARYSRVINKILPTVQTFTNPPFQRTIINDN